MNPDKIDSLVENSEADVDKLNSNRAHGGCDMSTEDANPMHLWYCRGPCKPDLYC
jgi:hypothetical protein